VIYSLDWIFLDDLGVSPIAQIFIKTSTTHQYPEHNELEFITPECMSVREIDEQIDRLHRELQDIRKALHRKFDNWRPRSSN
jgi:hypothetical protein